MDCYKSDPTEIDSDKDNLLDDFDPKALTTNNNGEVIELSSDELSSLQHWLEKLGYLNMRDNPYGESYGILTKTAVNLYQLNHGFCITDEMDNITYATIANDYCNRFDDEKYTLLYKKYFSHIPITKPNIMNYYSNGYSDFDVVLKDNSTFKSDKDGCLSIQLYLFDYTNPINEMIERNEKECRQQLWNSDTIYLYGWFFMKVNNGSSWDIKLSNRWKEQLPNITQYSKHFPFVFRGTVITAEILGNITYGYWGCCLNFTSDVLLYGGDFACGGVDSPEDKQDILTGILYYCIDHNDYSKLPIYNNDN